MIARQSHAQEFFRDGGTLGPDAPSYVAREADEKLPHLVKPLPTIFPIFKRFSGLLNAPLKFMGWLDKPSERGALVIKIGMVFYDAFTRV